MASNDAHTIKQKHAELEVVKDDPRVNHNGRKIVKAKGAGRNTESFDPKSTLVRPEMRILIGPRQEKLDRQIKHDDVVIVPEFFCKEDDWSIYYKLVEEMREAQASGVNKSEWISWHEGAHLISMNPTGSPTFHAIQEKISKYFGINNKAVGTRFNWYKDGTDWKPFHHDSAAFNPQRARNQNITVGVSFGSSRELSFLHAKDGSRIYFPQNNGMMFSFGRDVNLKWKHGINALSEEEIAAGGTNALGRVSIILWGLCPLTIEEDGSPPLLDGNGHSIHARPHDRQQGRPQERHDQGRDNHRVDHRADDRAEHRDNGRDNGRDNFRRDEPRTEDYRRDERPRGGDFRDEHRTHRRDDHRDDHRADRGGHFDRRERQDSRDRNGAGDRHPSPHRRGNSPLRRERSQDRARSTEEAQPRSTGGMGGALESSRSTQRADNKRSASPAGGATASVCRDFRRGSCRFGDRCKFQHSD